MGFRKTVKISKQDKLFSKYIRERDNWTCQACGRVFERGTGLLDNSHYMGRRFYATRFDEDNCEALCKSCHLKVGEDPEKHRNRIKARLGRVKLAKLVKKAKTNTLRRTVFENEEVYQDIKKKYDKLMERKNA